MHTEFDYDVVVIGGGLGGLANAALLGRAGFRVLLLEKSSRLGGRADTHEERGFLFNIGPHALYASAAGSAVLRELDVPVVGKRPPLNGAFALYGGQRHALPGGFVSLLSTSLLGVGAKVEVGRFMAMLPTTDAARFDSVAVDDWIHGALRDPTARELGRALVRLTTYADAPQIQSAGSAVRQLQHALATGVIYLDGGWRQLVGGLDRACAKHGIEICRGTRVTGLAPSDDEGVRIALADGRQLHARVAVVAADPALARELLPVDLHDALPAPSPAARAACLDVALETLPDPKATFALGIDRPLYFSVHSASAQLTPAAGGALVHALRYIEPGHEPDPTATETELESLFDEMQPGWRELVIHRRFLPRMVATNQLTTAADKGEAGRPPVDLYAEQGVFLVGDWIGPEGQLADATLASARDAALAIEQHIGRTGQHAA